MPKVQDESKVVVDGVEYHAVTNDQDLCYSTDQRVQCAFFSMKRSAQCPHYAGHPRCVPEGRHDKSHIIWVKAQ